MNEYLKLLRVFENAQSNRSLEISGKRRELVIRALRIAGGYVPEHIALLDKIESTHGFEFLETSAAPVAIRWRLLTSPSAIEVWRALNPLPPQG